MGRSLPIHPNGFIHINIEMDKHLDFNVKKQLFEARAEILRLIDDTFDHLENAKKEILSRPMESWAVDNESLCRSLKSIDDASLKASFIGKLIKDPKLQASETPGNFISFLKWN